MTVEELRQGLRAAHQTLGFEPEINHAMVVGLIELVLEESEDGGVTDEGMTYLEMLEVATRRALAFSQVPPVKTKSDRAYKGLLDFLAY
jgi:hypothetical protein